MTSKKRGLGEVLEVAALVSGCALLIYYSCKSDVQVDAPRDSKVFGVARSEGTGAGSSADKASRARAVEAAVGDLLRGVALGDVGEEQRSSAQKSLISLLEGWHWGNEKDRSTAAAVVVQQIFDQAKAQGVSSALSLRQVQAIRAVAKEMARQLLLLSVGSSAGADGISAPLPAGYERITWNQLGGFPYREGSELPPDVLALQGKSVGIPGFMLTLGDTDQLREFILVESLWGCCFGSVPEVNQTILVRLDPTRSAAYTAAPILVTGRLEVGEEREAGFVTSLYRIENAAIVTIDSSLGQ